MEISAEIDTKLKEKEKQLETKLEVTKAELTQKFMKPRLVTEGLTQTQMQEERRLRELIAAVSAQFETALASENTRSLKGKTESQGLYQLLLNSHLPQEAIAGAKAFNSHVQNFLRSYSAKDSPKADAPEVTAALAQEKELRMKAVSDLDKWLDVQTVPRPTPVQD